jgi:hypothetical protein
MKAAGRLIAMPAAEAPVLLYRIVRRESYLVTAL